MPPVPSPALEEARSRVTELVRDADERVDQLLARLLARLPKDGGSSDAR